MGEAELKLKIKKDCKTIKIMYNKYVLQVQDIGYIYNCLRSSVG